MRESSPPERPGQVDGLREEIHRFPAEVGCLFLQALDHPPPVAQEQVAGDLLLPPRLDELALQELQALGELRLGKLQRPGRQPEAEQALLRQLPGTPGHRPAEGLGLVKGEEADQVGLDGRQTARLPEGAVFGAAPFEAAPGREREDGGLLVDPGVAQGAAEEPDGRLLLVRAQVVHLIEQVEQARHPAPHLAQEVELHFGDRRVGRHQEEGRVALGEEVEGDLGVVPVGGADARRIDEDDTPFEDLRRVVDLHAGDAEAVARVRLLGDEALEERPGLLGGGGRPGLVGPLVAVAHPDAALRAVPHEGGHRRQRHHGRRQHGFPEQGVEQGALTPLELAEDGEVEPAPAQPVGELAERRRQRLELRVGPDERGLDLLQDG